MYALTNESLSVAILDPQADQGRFGTRYCTGGYIYQVVDAQRGELLSGPTYPASFNWFDGQGIPDAFNLGPLREPTASAGASAGQRWLEWSCVARRGARPAPELSADGVQITSRPRQIQRHCSSVHDRHRTLRSDAVRERPIYAGVATSMT